MSWLLVAFIPGLLMLATFGLDRLEASLDGAAVSPADVTACLEQAKADCAKPAVRNTDVETYELLDDEYEERVIIESPRDLPMRVFVHHGSNPEFQATRHAHRV
ncbi:hypothetical protein [Mycolicibacterium hodleri]|uniref:Uncharacterized protein n=1 Tax=Mycolicibacterium hodleri TaxID=49897 RepID=A0A502E0W4_9MYCO|nr:hypothetical protein [Mycolicibacterium hodleri]TPG31227.1 hypothetical protein EAH80_24870 [Mycolicibacterium hodleri]